MNILSTSLILLIANPSTSLVDAYKKELAFLEAERKALKTQLSRFEKSAKKDIAKADSEIVKLQGELPSIRNKTDASEITFEKSKVKPSRPKIALTSSDTVSRSFESLERAGIELPELAEGTEGQAAIRFGCRQNAYRTRRANSLRGLRVFSQNGQSLKGKIVKIGNVAAYGMSGILPVPFSSRFRAIGVGIKTQKRPPQAFWLNSPETLSMFVFADLEKPIEQK